MPLILVVCPLGDRDLKCLWGRPLAPDQLIVSLSVFFPLLHRLRMILLIDFLPDQSSRPLGLQVVTDCPSFIFSSPLLCRSHIGARAARLVALYRQ